MKVSYHRDLNKNYLIISDLEITGKEYMLRMMSQNRIPGFLPLAVRVVNGEHQLFYEITSMVSLSAAYENRQIGWLDLEKMVSSITDALRQAERYLIGTENIALDPELMYLDPDTGKVSVLLLPCKPENKDGMTQAQILAEFVLRRLNHEDRKAVDMGYAFYRMASEDRFSFEMMEAEIREQRTVDRRSLGSGYEAVVRAADQRPGYAAGELAETDHEGGYTEGKSAGYEENAFMTDLFQTNENRAAKGKETGKKKSRKEIRKEKKEERETAKKKKRLAESAQQQKKRKIIFWVCVVLACAVVYGLILLLFRLDLSQAGGLAFLMIAVGWLITESVIRKRREGKNHWSDEVDDDDDLMDALLEELYDQERREEGENFSFLDFRSDGKKNRGRSSGTSTGTSTGTSIGTSIGTSPGKTRALVTEDMPAGLVLVSLDPRRYKDIALNDAAVVIGKSPDLAQAVVDHDAVSRIHARVEVSPEGTVTITDLNSMNGVMVNGKMLAPMTPMEIKAEDMVGIADLKYRLRRRG